MVKAPLEKETEFGERRSVMAYAYSIPEPEEMGDRDLALRYGLLCTPDGWLNAGCGLFSCIIVGGTNTAA